MAVKGLEQRYAKMQFGDKPRLNLYRKFAKMLVQGVPLLKVVEDYRQRVIDSDGKGAPLAVMLGAWEKEISSGIPLGTVLQDWVPESERMIIAASENAGKLEKGLLSAATMSASGAKIASVIKGGLAYPFAVLAMALGYVYIFGTKVIPEFVDIIDPNTWAPLAYSLYVMSVFVQTKFIYLVAGLISFVALLFVLMPIWTGRLRVIADRYPPFSVYRMLRGSGFLVAFSALIGAGVTIEKALDKLRPGASRWLAERIDAVQLLVKSGSSFGAALRDAGHQFPAKELVDDLVVYSMYSGFDQALETLVEEWMTEGVERITTLMKAINSIAILVLGLIVVWLVGGFFGIQGELSSIAQKGVS